MPGTGPGGHEITLAEAKTLINRFRGTQTPDSTNALSHRIGRAVIERILAQDGCIGLCIYHARKEQRDDRGGPETLVIVGVAESGADLTGVIAEETWFCPPFCSVPSVVEAKS